MIKWLKNKLRVWLGIKSIHHTQRVMYNDLSDIVCRTINLECDNKEYKARIELLEKELDLFKSMCQVGTDVHMKTDSWAVVCLDGKPEYINFVRLDSRDARDVKQFLKRFDKAQRITDAPYRMMDYFKW